MDPIRGLIGLMLAMALIGEHTPKARPSKWFRIVVLTLSVLAAAGGFYFCWIGDTNTIRMTSCVAAVVFSLTFAWQARKLAQED